jgi:predicted DNA-binding transcriptional regulator YafY
MSKRSDTASTLEVALAILERLDPLTAITPTEMAKTLVGHGRNLRTIQRQLKLLAEMGLAEVQGAPPNLTYKRSFRGGKQVSALTPGEALLLRLAEQQVKLLVPPNTAEGLKVLFERAFSALQPPPLPNSPASLRTGSKPDPFRERAWLHKVGVAPLSMVLKPPKLEDSVRETVAQALFRDEWLSIRYSKGPGQRARDRRVIPLALMQQGPRLYLIARDEKEPHSGQELQFALHRIVSAKAVGLPLPSDRDPFDLQDYIDSGRAAFGDGSSVHVVFNIVPDLGHILTETPLSDDQVIEPAEDGWVRVSATVPDSLAFWDWLRAFGHRAELVEPEERVDALWDDYMARPSL